MPNYKTHSIHSEMVLPYIDKRIYIDKELLKIFSFGPDALVFSDIRTFDNQHNKDSKLFFECLIKTIKMCNYQYDNEIMAFLYGQLEHFILDSTFHPYIFYVTPSIRKKYLLDNHANFELWLDDYFMEKYDKRDKKYYSKRFCQNLKLRSIIDYVYRQIYSCYYASNKYSFGTDVLLTLENARSNDKVIPVITKKLGISDISYDKLSRINPFLNTNRDEWYNPFTLEKHKESINELWNKSVELYMQVIEDVNGYLYDNKEYKNSIIDNDLSYDTGLPACRKKTILVTKYINKEV